MNHRPAKLDDTRERRLDVRHLKVRQRPAVTWSRPALVHAELHSARTRLQPPTLVIMPLGEGRAKHPFPEAACPLEVVSGKLNQLKHHREVRRER